MKVNILILLLIFVIIALPLTSAFPLSGSTILAEAGIFSYGLKTERTSNNLKLDSIPIPYVKTSFETKISKKGTLEINYSYNYIIQSILSFGYRFNFDTTTITIGASTGFFNNINTKISPGFYFNSKIIPFKHICLDIYGHSSFFIKKFFSLKSVSYNFDQNILYTGLYYFDNTITFGFIYRRNNIYKISGSVKTDNTLTDYQLKIKTNVKDSWINSETILGGNISHFSETGIKLSFLQFYIDQTLFIKIKNFTIIPGIRANILNFTLKDLKSTNPPSVPNFTIHTGLKFSFGKR